MIDGGAGGSATSSSSGGGTTTNSSSTSSSTNTSTTGTTTSSGTSLGCKGWDDPACGPEAWCDTGGVSCAGPGTCQPRPGACDADCPGVCACDGKIHCNECGANAQGVPVAADAACIPPPPTTYRAVLWLGGLDHLIVTKQDPEHDLCIKLFADWPTSGMPQYAIDMPKDWGVSNIVATSNAGDCDDPQSQPQGEQVYAASAIGAISWELPPGKMYPCELSIKAMASFDQPPAWLDAQQPLLAGPIKVENGCL